MLPVAMPNLNQLSDEALVLLLKQENVDAFEELYNRYWDKLYAAAYKRVRSKEVSEELVQDIYTSFFSYAKMRHLWFDQKAMNTFVQLPANG